MRRCGGASRRERGLRGTLGVVMVERERERESPRGERAMADGWGGRRELEGG